VELENRSAPQQLQSISAAGGAQGAVRYERIAEEELEAKQAEKEAIRQAAREAAGFMAKEDPAPPSFDEFDD